MAPSPPRQRGKSDGISPPDPVGEGDSVVVDDETDSVVADDEADAVVTDDEADAVVADDEADAVIADDETDSVVVDDEADAFITDDEADVVALAVELALVEEPDVADAVELPLDKALEDTEQEESLLLPLELQL